jgi:hypothetical protein
MLEIGLPQSERPRKEESIMKWEPPTFIEINMDAEIGSYQEETDGPDLNEAHVTQPCVSEF